MHGYTWCLEGLISFNDVSLFITIRFPMLYDFLKKENGVSDAVCTNRTAHEVSTWKQLPKKLGENACTNTAIVASYKFYRKWFLTFYCHGILHRCILSNSYTSLLVHTRTLTLWNYHIWFHNVSGSILIRIWTQQGITAHTTAVLKSTRIKQSLHCSKSLWDILHP